MKSLLPAGLVSILAFLLYVWTLAPAPFPGTPAHMMSAHLGVSPFAPVEQPLYGVAARALGRMAGPASAAKAIHLFNALCGALACGLVTVCASKLARVIVPAADSAPGTVESSARISGIAAGVFLATSLPVWMLSTRSLPDALGMVLMGFYFLCCLNAVLVRRTPWIHLASLFYGLGLAEFASFIGLFIPHVLLLLVLSVNARGRFRWRFLLGQGALLVVGFLLILQTAWFAWKSPSAVFRGWTGFGDALWACFKNQHRLALLAIPVIGWLSLFAQTYVPLTLLLAFRSKLRSARGPFLLHVLLTTLVLAVLLDARLISPLRILNPEGRMDQVFGTPYLAVALTAGLLCGIWWMRLRHRPRLLGAWRSAGRAAFRRLLLPGLAALALFLGWKNFSVADGRVAAYSARWVSAILEEMQDRQILFADGWIGSLVELEARARGRAGLRVVSTDLSSTPPYLRWLSSWQDDPALRSLTRVGIGPYQQGLLAPASRRFTGTAFFSSDSAIVAAGLEAHPARSLFIPAEKSPGPPVEDWAERMRRLEAIPLSALSALRELRHPMAPFCAEWLRVQSKLANNTGVALQHAGNPSAADEAYQWAGRLHPDNVSALLNRLDLMQTGKSTPADANRLREDYAEFLKELGTGRFRIWALADAYGMLASSQAHADRGLAWAVSGNPARAVRDIERAIELAGDDARLRLAMAGVLFSGGDADRAGAEYRRVLEQNPADPDAQLGLARVEALRGEYAEARARLARLAAGREDDPALLLEVAVVDMLEGSLREALDKVRAALKGIPKDHRALTLQAVLAAQTGESREFTRAIDTLMSDKTLPVQGRYSVAVLLRQHGRPDEARRMARLILDENPGHRPTLDFALRLCVEFNDHITAKKLTRSILALEPADAYALMILGSLHYLDRQLTLAEEAFRASLNGGRTPEALNSLGFVLYDLGRYEEGLVYAGEALSTNRLDPAVWDTVAMLQKGVGRLDEAMESIRKAVELAPEHLDFRLHLAMIHAARGEMEPTREIMRELGIRKSALSPAGKVTYDAFQLTLYRMEREAVGRP